MVICGALELTASQCRSLPLPSKRVPFPPGVAHAARTVDRRPSRQRSPLGTVASDGARVVRHQVVWQLAKGPRLTLACVEAAQCLV